MQKSVFSSNDLSSPFTIAIEHDQEIMIKKNRRPLPLFYGFTDTPATIQATITLNAQQEYVAHGVEILFLTVVTTDTFEGEESVDGR